MKALPALIMAASSTVQEASLPNRSLVQSIALANLTIADMGSPEKRMRDFSGALPAAWQG